MILTTTNVQFDSKSLIMMKCILCILPAAHSNSRNIHSGHNISTTSITYIDFVCDITLSIQSSNHILRPCKRATSYTYYYKLKQYLSPSTVKL